MGIFEGLFGPPTRDRYAKLLLAEIRKLGVECSIQYDADSFQLVESGTDRPIDLANVYYEYCTLPKGNRSAHLTRTALAFFGTNYELSSDVEQLRDNLRPKIWTRATMANLELQQRLRGDESLDLPLYPLGEHLFASLAYDLPHAMRSVSNRDLAECDLSYYEAMETACENLDDSTLRFDKIAEGVYSATTGDNYDSSRVLLDNHIAEFDFRGDVVAVLPHRDGLYLTGSADDAGLATILELTRQAFQDAPRPLCPIPICRIEDQWQTWIPPLDHTLHDEYQALALLYLGNAYAEQKELLDQLHQRELTDVFVASLSGLQRDSEERTISYCVWGAGVDSLLPRSEYIMLPSESGLVACGKWERVRRIVGDLLQPVPEFYPIRYRAREFPTPVQLEQIGLENI